jgi:hypothetical protein
MEATGISPVARWGQHAAGSSTTPQCGKMADGEAVPQPRTYQLSFNKFQEKRNGFEHEGIEKSD